MKNLFYRLAISRSLAKLFSMYAQPEERKRVIFSKRLFFAILGLAAFMSLGAFVFPHAAHAQCVWDCDLGSDTLDNPWGNSPQALDIVYCFDRDCVLNLKDGSGNPIFTGNSIPTPNVTQKTDPDPLTCDSISLGKVTISGNVVALLRDSQGNLDPQSAAQATLLIVIKGVICSGSAGSTILSRVVRLNEARTNVFDGSSSITILAPTTSTPANLPSRGWTGCTTDKKTGKLLSNCPFPLGIVEFTKFSDLSNQLPQDDFFQFVGEVYRGVESLTALTPRSVGIRDCKGDANSTDPSTITCTRGSTVAVGGGDSVALFTFPGNWSGATNHTINPNSGNNPFDIGPTPLFDSILPETVTASANDGPQVPNNGCFDQTNQSTERCFFTASALLPNGCSNHQVVNILVTGKLRIGNTDFKFVSRDNPTCSK